MASIELPLRTIGDKEQKLSSPLFPNIGIDYNLCPVIYKITRFQREFHTTQSITATQYITPDMVALSAKGRDALDQVVVG